MLTAMVREVSARFAECEVSFQERSSIDGALARAQHAEYCRVLSGWERTSSRCLRSTSLQTACLSKIP